MALNVASFGRLKPIQRQSTIMWRQCDIPMHAAIQWQWPLVLEYTGLNALLEVFPQIWLDPIGGFCSCWATFKKKISTSTLSCFFQSLRGIFWPLAAIKNSFANVTIERILNKVWNKIFVECMAWPWSHTATSQHFRLPNLRLPWSTQLSNWHSLPCILAQGKFQKKSW